MRTKLSGDGKSRDITASYFERTFNAIDEACGDNALRRYDAAKQRFSGPFLISAFELVALGVAANIDFVETRGTPWLEQKIKAIWADARTFGIYGQGVSTARRLPRTLEVGRAFFRKLKMIADGYCTRISDDWLWREKELRGLDRRLFKKPEVIDVKAGILIIYSHWEGHFKLCAIELLSFMEECIKRKAFKWTQVTPDVRQRILFCSYRRASLSDQRHETFVSYLNALHDERFSSCLSAVDEIVMVDDNLNTLRAEAICRNLGVDYSWFITKKIIIDDRLLEHRNAVAHGAKRLRSGDFIDFTDPLLIDALQEVRSLIRDTRDRFQNAINLRSFLHQ